MKLNQNSATPLYLQVCNFILSEIKNGKYKEGDKIPSEWELCKQFELSRTTIRSAIAALTSQDILVRRQGKGTFVRKQKPFLSLPKKEDSESSPSFSSGGFVLESGVKLTSRISLKTFVPATKNDIMMLGLSPEDQVFLYITSYFVNGKPAAMEEYFLHPKYASLAEQDLENDSIWELLEKHFSIHETIRSKKTIEIARAGKEEASALHVSKGEPMLLLRQVVSETDGTPILRIKEYILGDTYKYVV